LFQISFKNANYKPKGDMAKGMKKTSEGPTRTKQEREQDLIFIAPFILKGVGYTQIAKELAANRTYEISVKSVTKDAKAIVDQWHKETLATLSKAKAREIAKINNLERVYHEAWERSCQPLRKKVVKRGGDMVTDPQTNERRLLNPNEVREEETMVQRVGDARFLLGIERCIAARVKLLGLDKQAAELPGQGGDVSEYTAPEVRDITFSVRPRRDREAIEEAEEIGEDEQRLLGEG
jgi:hypothetical protein